MIVRRHDWFRNRSRRGGFSRRGGCADDSRRRRASRTRIASAGRRRAGIQQLGPQRLRRRLDLRPAGTTRHGIIARRGVEPLCGPHARSGFGAPGARRELGERFGDDGRVRDRRGGAVAGARDDVSSSDVGLARPAARGRKGRKNGLGSLLVAIGLLIVTQLDKELEAMLVAASAAWLMAFTTRFRGASQPTGDVERTQFDCAFVASRYLLAALHTNLQRRKRKSVIAEPCRVVYFSPLVGIPFTAKRLFKNEGVWRVRRGFDVVRGRIVSRRVKSLTIALFHQQL